MARKKHIEPADAADEADDARGRAASSSASERAWQAALRPRTFDEYIGQRDLIENLRSRSRAAKEGGWALDHFLFAGPPGLGKTTLAHVIANELGVNLHVSSGPAIDHKGKLASLLDVARRGRRAVHRRDPPAARRSSRRTSIPRWRTSGSTCSSATARTRRR